MTGISLENIISYMDSYKDYLGKTDGKPSGSAGSWTFH